jgi:hypothetical protein
MTTYCKPRQVKDLREHGRAILAHGESTGHCHEVRADVDDVDTIPPYDYFEEPDGRRVLFVTRTCRLVHEEHGAITLDPDRPTLVRQGDVLLTPIGRGAWSVGRQREYTPEAIVNVAD